MAKGFFFLTSSTVDILHHKMELMYGKTIQSMQK